MLFSSRLALHKFISSVGNSEGSLQNVFQKLKQMHLNLNRIQVWDKKIH